MKLRPNAPDIQALLAAEQDFPLEEPARQARVLSAVRQAIVALPLPDSGPPADGGQSPAGPAAGGAPATGGAASLGSAGAGSAASLGQLITVGLVAFVAGGGAGAGVYHLVAGQDSERPVAVAGPPTGQQESTDADSSSHEEASTGVSVLDAASDSDSDQGVVAQDTGPRHHPLVGRPPETRAEAGTTTEARARERQIIEIARAAVARGNARAALEAVRRHAREFPSGRLSEEREALRILALVSAGRTSEAEQWARTFRRRHQGSIFAPAIDRALARSRRDGGR